MEVPTLAFFNLPGGMEWIVILIVGLLIFGRRLPDVARSVGKSIVEFKKGMRDVREDIEKEPSAPSLASQGDASRTLPAEQSTKNGDQSTTGI